MDRIAEIESRITAIRAEIDTADANQLTALESEIETLNTERRTITETAERRAQLLAGIASRSVPATPVATVPVASAPAMPEYRTRDDALKSPEYKSYWAKTLMCRSDITDAEKRAAGVALTTTATTYVAADASNDGVNNGGLFIPTDLNLALMERISVISPIFRDVAKTEISGNIKFPYRKNASTASMPAEGTANTDGQVEWGEITLTACEISETIRVSWKLESMAVDAFINFIYNEIVDQCIDKIINQVIYGVGGTDALTGVTVGAIDTTYTAGDYLDGIESCIGSITDAKLKIGAKLYISQAAAESICFARDANDNFVYTPINSAGIKTIATYPVEIDPYLNTGDIVFGNLSRQYRFNTNETVTVTKDVSGVKRVNDYTAYAIVSGAPVPGRIAYATTA